MNKFKKFCQKPLLIASISLIAFCIIAIVVMICIPHGKVYKLSYEVDGTKFNYQIVLDDKYSAKHTYVLNGKTYSVGDIDGIEYNYEVVDGELFILDGGTSNQKIKIGNIDSRKIVLEYNILGDDADSVLKCKVNTVLTTIFVVGLYSGIAFLVASIVVICLNKKNKETQAETKETTFGQKEEVEEEIKTEEVVAEEPKVEENMDVEQETKE